MLPPRTYQPDHLSGILLAYAMGNLILRGLHALLSALIPSAHSYPAMPLAEQLVHQRCVHPGPLTKDSSSQISYAHDG